MSLGQKLAFLRREPVMLGAAALAVYEAQFADASSAWKLAVGGVIAWVVRMLSTSNVTAEAKVDAATEAAKNETLAFVSLLTPEPDAKKPSPIKKAAKK